MKWQAPHSLRARLLGFLIAAIAATAALQAGVAYRTARAEADAIFDWQMQQTAQSLRPGLAPAPDGAPPDDENFDFVVQVWTSEGLRVFESAARAALPQRAVLGFSDVRARGTTYRVFSLQTRSQVIQVAQDMAVRREMAAALALRTVAPIALMVPVLMLLVWWVVGTSLAPVARVGAQLAQRQADDLSEVAETGLPDELRPMVRELNLLLERVRQAFDAQKNFVADAAHELRSPLAALSLQIQGLRRAGDDAARDVAVARLSAGVERATRLVEQLLVLARQQASAAAGAAPLPVVLADVVRQAIETALPQAHARGVDLGFERADDATIPAHADALRILLRNLLENAIRHAREGGRVDVEVRRGAGAVVLAVSDDGPGIPPAERARVLDRFYRVAGTGSTGSGLGLAIVKSIADLHGARLALEDSPTLGGLRVVVDFPEDGRPA